MLDAARWPIAAEYLRSLPEGLASFPDCQVLGTAYRGARERVRESGDPGSLPAPMKAFFEETDDKKWVPEVIGLCFQMMMFDLEGEEAGIRWFYDDAKRIYKSPVLRYLMKLMSPTLVVMGAASRWGALRQGTKLESDPARKDADRIRAIARLHYPAGLYPQRFIAGLAESFRAALDGARGSDVQVVVVDQRPGVAEYECSWAR